MPPGSARPGRRRWSPCSTCTGGVRRARRRCCPGARRSRAWSSGSAPGPGPRRCWGRRRTWSRRWGCRQPGRAVRAGWRHRGLHRIVVEDRDQRVVVGAEAVGPGAVEVGERVHRRRVHPLVDDADVERVGVLAGGERDVLVGDGVEVDAGLRVLALDPVTDVLLAAEIAGPLDGDRQIALVLVRGVGGLVQGDRSRAGAVMGHGRAGGGGDHERQTEAGDGGQDGSGRERVHGLWVWGRMTGWVSVRKSAARARV